MVFFRGEIEALEEELGLGSGWTEEQAQLRQGTAPYSKSVLSISEVAPSLSTHARAWVDRPTTLSP